jgi:hypothetical protein
VIGELNERIGDLASMYSEKPHTAVFGSPEGCALLFTAPDSCTPDEPAQYFWGLPRQSKSRISVAQTVGGAKAVLGAVDGIVQRGLDAMSAAEEGAKLFLFDLMLTNLGAVQIETSYGSLLLRDLWVLLCSSALKENRPWKSRPSTDACVFSI